MGADSRAALEVAFAPRSVAIVGASANPAKFGYRIVDNLIKGGYTGRIYPVNPRTEPICGLTTYPSLEQVPRPVDVAVLFVPADQTLQVIRQCGPAGVRVAVVIAAGFAEQSAEGARNQEVLLAAAREAGVRLVGPNCQGIVNFQGGMLLSFSLMYPGLSPGPVSLISQSGSYSGIVCARLAGAGVGIAKVISSGNEADLLAVDYLDYLAGDADTRVILAHLEGVREPRRFARVLREVSAIKPVVVNKTGRTETGRRQAMSHSAALAGNHRVLDALVRQCGAVGTNYLDQLVSAALALASQPPLPGNRVVVLSTAGGLAVEMADLLVESGFAIPPLSPEAGEMMRRHVPSYGTVANPVDLMNPTPRQVGDCLDAALADPGMDAVCCVMSAFRDPEFSREIHARLSGNTKPVLICWTAGRDRAGEALEYFTARGVPVFESTLGIVQGLAALRDYWRFRLGDKFREEGVR